MASRWVQCDACSKEYYYGNRISSGYRSTNNPDNPDEVEDCPVCYGRRGFWVDQDTGYHSYHVNDILNDIDPNSEKNNRSDDE